MIDKQTARQRVLELLNGASGDAETSPYTIIDVVEEAFCWVVIWCSRRALENGSTEAGSAPIIVDKTTGHLQQTGTEREAEYYIAEHAETVAPGSIRYQLLVVDPHDGALLMELRGARRACS